MKAVKPAEIKRVRDELGMTQAKFLKHSNSAVAL